MVTSQQGAQAASCQGGKAGMGRRRTCQDNNGAGTAGQRLSAVSRAMDRPMDKIGTLPPPWQPHDRVRAASQPWAQPTDQPAVGLAVGDGLQQQGQGGGGELGHRGAADPLRIPGVGQVSAGDPSATIQGDDYSGLRWAQMLSI